MDRLTEIVEQAIALAEIVRQYVPDHNAEARQRLDKIAAELRADAPDHPAVAQLENYIQESNR